MTRETGSKRAAIWAWCLYDFANSPFTTLVVTFIYATFFVKVIAADEITGTVLWSRAVMVTAVVVALLSPFMGALADRGGWRKRFLFVSTAICIAGTLGLYYVLPGQAVTALVFFAIANIAFEMGMVFYNAFLPEITTNTNIGRVSGAGWGLGYGGGLIALVLALVGFVQGEAHWFGMVEEAGQNIRATNLLTAAWFALFSVPLFLFVPGQGGGGERTGVILKQTVRQLRTTFTEVRRYRQVGILLLARLIYNDGLVTIFAFGGIYAAGTFGFEIDEILIFGIVLNITAGAGAFAMGYMDDALGGKKTLIVTLLGLTFAALFAVLAPSKPWFWAAGIMVGIFAGPNQAASRSLLGRFVPPGKENEFFGFFAFSGKATAFMGPALLGVLTGWFDSQRAGVAVVIAFFLVGWWVLAKVDEAEGIRMAESLPTPGA